ncbi:hypothetical protein AAFP30_04815 [Gordonia sp. CPCC 205515]|uniref:hypothetical protein n=1 Tax=Gordonia sp. CPCC 205515 TaxID=3140791 RepID=UPI003AF3F21E
MRRISVDSAIEYLFGTGDGHTTSWVSAGDADLDGDGTADAVRLDFDGDGHRDDAMWDIDGDGTADLAALDIDDDGRPDAFYRDTGSGVWGVPADRPAAAAPGTGPAGPPEPAAEKHPDAVARSADLDRDGRPDIELRGTRRAGVPVAQRLYVDEDGDGRFDRVLVDENGDGRADVSYDDDSPKFGAGRQ